MPTPIPEQKARQQIDAVLVASGWVIQDHKTADLSVGNGIVLAAPLQCATRLRQSILQKAFEGEL